MQQVMYLEERCFRPTLVINTPGFANGHYDTLHVWGHHRLPKEGRILLHASKTLIGQSACQSHHSSANSR